MGVLEFIVFLVIAAACAFIAERIVPSMVAGGFLTSAVVGVVGAWIGGTLIGPFGPDVGGVSLIPCIIGSAILVFGLSLLSRGLRNRRA